MRAWHTARHRDPGSRHRFLTGPSQGPCAHRGPTAPARPSPALLAPTPPPVPLSWPLHCPQEQSRVPSARPGAPSRHLPRSLPWAAGWTGEGSQSLKRVLSPRGAGADLQCRWLPPPSHPALEFLAGFETQRLRARGALRSFCAPGPPVGWGRGPEDPRAFSPIRGQGHLAPARPAAGFSVPTWTPAGPCPGITDFTPNCPLTRRLPRAKRSALNLVPLCITVLHLRKPSLKVLEGCVQGPLGSGELGFKPRHPRLLIQTGFSSAGLSGPQGGRRCGEKV